MDEKQIRREIRQLLDEKGFLRLHRAENALYVTDFPLHFPQLAEEKQLLLTQSGYLLRPDEKNPSLWQIDLTAEKWQTLLQSAQSTPPCAPVHHGLASLERLFSRFDTEYLPIARMLLKASGQNITDPDRLWRQLSAQYALCLRQHACRPGKGCAGLLRQCMKGMAE